MQKKQNQLVKVLTTYRFNMRFKDLKDAKIRSSAVNQYILQIGADILQPYQVLDHYVSFLDYYHTLEGFDYWNEIRPLREIPNARGNRPRRIFLHRGQEPQDISEEFKKVLDSSTMSIVELSKKSGYKLKSLNEILNKNRLVGATFINDISFILKVNPEKFYKDGVVIIEDRSVDRRPIPEGEKRICTTCKKSKDLENEYNKFKYGVYQKASMCRECYNAYCRNSYKNNKSK